MVPFLQNRHPPPTTTDDTPIYRYGAAQSRRDSKRRNLGHCLGKISINRVLSAIALRGDWYENHRLGYSVETTDGDVLPIDVGNLGDRDNYEHLYLDTDSKPLRVSMKGGLLIDPRDDPNPTTSVAVAGFE